MIGEKCRPAVMCTLTAGQIFEQEQLVKDMHAAGMSRVRLNTAHLHSVDELGSMARRLRELCPGIAILIDTKGPEMRTTDTDAPVALAEGDSIVVKGDEGQRITSASTIYVNFPLLHEHAEAGQRLLIDDASIILEVTRVEGRSIMARVAKGGLLGSRKGMAIEGVDVPLPAVNSHDREFIAYAAASDDVDVIAHSFVRQAADVLAVHQAMFGGCKPVIAKIESQQGIDNIGEIIAVADGLLIARGDLTASIGRDHVPAAQQLIADAAKAASKELYLATNILPSLMQQPEPSAADIDGIRLAMAQGVDVMLLTNETASGPRPLQSVQALSDALRR